MPRSAFKLILICLQINLAYLAEQAGKNEEQGEIFTFDCGAKNILMFHNSTEDKIMGTCYIPYICGEVKGCIPSVGPACPGKFQYLEAVRIINKKTVTSICCTPNPLPNGDESCREVTIVGHAKPKPSTAAPPPPLQTTRYSNPLTSRKPGTPAARKKSGRQSRAISNSEASSIILETEIKSIMGEKKWTDEYIKAIKVQPNGFSVTVCTPICSSSTSTVTRTPTTPTPTQKRTDRPTTQARTEAPRQNEAHAPKKGLFGGNGHGCFSSDMTVVTPQGVKRMDELDLGDKVLVFTAESSTKFHPITWFHHRDPNSTMKYLDLKTSSGARLSITPNHLIPFVDCDRKLITPSEMDQLMATSTKFASRANIGSCIAIRTVDGIHFKPDLIVSIRQTIKAGLYSPITTQGTIVVNGIQTSCFNSVENHLLLTAIHSSWDRLTSVLKRLPGSFGVSTTSEQPEQGIPSAILFLLELAKRVIPEYVFS